MKRTLLLPFFVAVLLAGTPAGADEPPPPDQAAEQARAAFKQGAQAVEEAEWSRALEAFERSRSLVPHPLTTYNIAVCQRFLGRYTLARATFQAALAETDAAHPMPALFLEQAKTYMAEIDRKLVTVTVHARPAAAAVLVEGRPLVPGSAPDVFVAGTAPAGKPTSPQRETYTVLVDPGNALFSFSLAGYDTIEIARSLKPGTKADVDVSMAEQPATIRLTADQRAAIVRFDGTDLGPAPVSITRGPGEHRLTITKDGFTTYDTRVTLRAGQYLPLDARLVPEKTPLYKKWWFWTSAGVAAVGIGLVTFLVVRPAPTRPEVDRGGLNWAAQVP